MLTLEMLKTEPPLLGRLLFIALEGTRLADVANEIDTAFPAALTRLQTTTAEMVLVVLEGGLCEFFLARQPDAKSSQWTTVAAAEWETVIADPATWRPEEQHGNHYELGITAAGRDCLAALARSGTPIC